MERDSLLAQTATKLQDHVHIQVVYKYEVCLSSVTELKHTSQITSKLARFQERERKRSLEGHERRKGREKFWRGKHVDG